MAAPAAPKPTIGMRMSRKFSRSGSGCRHRAPTRRPDVAPGGQPRVRPQEKDRPSWLTCPGIFRTSRISSAIDWYPVSGTSPSTWRSSEKIVGPPASGYAERRCLSLRLCISQAGSSLRWQLVRRLPAGRRLWIVSVGARHRSSPRVTLRRWSAVLVPERETAQERCLDAAPCVGEERPVGRGALYGNGPAHRVLHRPRP